MKHKSTIAKEITKTTKQLVWDRQKGKSIFPPYIPISVEECCCHYISRTGSDPRGGVGAGGIGEEWNIFGCSQNVWRNEHQMFDDSKPIGNLTHAECVSVVRNHLIMNYINWSEEKCRYNKLGNEPIKRRKEAYGIIPRI